jgi:light-regulated signal transduction histidine kinase (bacteriophytochrome)
MRPETLFSAPKTALRARMKQYEARSRQEALLQANADLEHFAHSASHDLKEPLRNIRIFSELLSTEYGNTLDERAKHFLQLISDGGKRMDQLLEDLRSYAFTSGITGQVTDPIPANKALELALANLAAPINETGARITSGELPQVRMSEVHLAQLFQNLISNAIQYRREDAPPHISVAANPAQNRLVFSITDNGIGIDPEYKEAIFGIFKRLHTSRAGTGMGLAICQRIVERYRGRIWVESEPRNGSTFFFSIPA